MSEQEFADLETALRVAKSEYEVELLNARATVAEAWAFKGDLDIAAQRLVDATTRAPSTPEATTQPVDTGRAPAEPHSYVVTARLVNVGELVREITPCYRLVDLNPIKLRARVPERFIAQVKNDQAVRIKVDAYGNEEFAGKVSRINPQVDLDNRTFSIEVVIPNDDFRLKPGSFARGLIETYTQPNVVFAPQEALVSFAGVNKVFKVGPDNKAVETRVDPGTARAENGAYVEIAQGLKGDEKLAVWGTNKLTTGSPVVIKEAAATRESGGGGE